MSKQKELSRFTGSGKTFFFNKGEAKNGTDYLAVNTIYGKGSQERIVLFPPHYMEFRKHITGAMESLMGVKFVDTLPPSPEPHVPELPIKCPKCGMGSDGYDIAVISPKQWIIECGKCITTIYDTANFDD